MTDRSHSASENSSPRCQPGPGRSGSANPAYRMAKATPSTSCTSTVSSGAAPTACVIGLCARFQNQRPSSPPCESAKLTTTT